jgi:hypothetical protein
MAKSHEKELKFKILNNCSNFKTIIKKKEKNAHLKRNPYIPK